MAYNAEQAMTWVLECIYSCELYQTNTNSTLSACNTIFWCDTALYVMLQAQ